MQKRNLKKLLCLFTLIFVLGVSLFAPERVNASQLPVMPDENQTLPEDCVFIGVEGEYVTDSQAVVDRINEIRYEACKESVVNPSTGKPLTLADYVPIKWSSGLETIARYRASNAGIAYNLLGSGHNTLNGSSIWGYQYPSGCSPRGEIIAYNWTTDVLYGVEQWYGEKSDWVNAGGGQTGHYEALINPGNTYIGLATFYTKDTYYPNTTAAQLGSGNGLDETFQPAVGKCIQKLAIKNEYISTLSIEGSDVTYGKSKQLVLKAEIKGMRNMPEILEGAKWASSDPSVATVSDKGIVTGKKLGKATITAQAGSLKATYEINVVCNHSYRTSWTIDKAATTTKNGSKSHRCTIPSCTEKKDVTTIYAIDKVKLSATSYVYDGKVKKPSVSVKDKKGNTIPSSCYTVSYSKGRKNVGVYRVTIRFKNGYSGTIYKSFKIAPKKTSIKRLTAGKKNITVQFGRVSKQVTGYQIQYAVNKNFTSGKKTVTIKKNTVTSKKLTGLKSGKRYYVRIRTYKKTGTKTYYSGWSAVKNISVK